MKTILITGIGRGIGKALAKKFLDEGYFVIGTSTTGKSDLKNENLEVFELDLSKKESIENCVKKISGLKKKIDILINNAGILLDDEETKVIPELLRATLEVNLVGTVDFTERIILLLDSSAHIINISSTAGSLELAMDQRSSHYPMHYPAYKISKGALNMYTRTLASRLLHEGITVSSIHPGWVRTEMGGEEADMSTEEAAEGIFETATSDPPTGGFWFKGKRLPW